jgi:hypothetical protein
LRQADGSADIRGGVVLDLAVARHQKDVMNLGSQSQVLIEALREQQDEDEADCTK